MKCGVCFCEKHFFVFTGYYFSNPNEHVEFGTHCTYLGTTFGEKLCYTTRSMHKPSFLVAVFTCSTDAQLYLHLYCVWKWIITSYNRILPIYLQILHFKTIKCFFIIEFISIAFTLDCGFDNFSDRSFRKGVYGNVYSVFTHYYTDGETDII